MRSLNGCIPLKLVSMENLTPTRYWEICPLDNKSSLLLHLLTGAIDILNSDEVIVIQKLFEDGEIFNLPDSVKFCLTERGYLSNPESEQIFIDDLAKRHQEQIRKKPIECFICTTFSCPLGCSYCFEGKLTTEAKAKAINTEQISSIFKSIEKIIEEQNRPLKEIVLFGGEPLLPITMNAVSEILKQAADRNFKVSVCTSGIFCEEFLPLLREFSEVVSVVRITIDGTQEYHNSLRTLPSAFERAAIGIDSLLQANIRVMTRTNVGKQNVDVIPAMANYFVERKWTNYPNFEAIITGIKDRGCLGDKGQLFREDELAFRFLEMRSRFEAIRFLRPVNIFMSLRHLATNLGHLEGIVRLQDAVTPLQTIKFHGCGATDGTLYVFGVDNKVYTCTEAIGKPFMSVGKYFPELDLDQNRVGKWQGWHKYNIPECRDCKYLLICGGTCTMSSVSQFGSGKKPVCPPIKNIVEGYVSALSSRIAIV
ncbi:MAG: 4Fe-4S cluster-binding domain-containing protein [bacterium]|nr:4Fe-4S cluster-binding domain-containing protein [bacterium]